MVYDAGISVNGDDGCLETEVGSSSHRIFIMEKKGLRGGKERL